MPQSGPFDLSATYLRLRPDASVEPLPVDATFCQRIAAGELGTFHNEYLVAVHAFDADWKVWEMHPNGEEIVCLLSGAATFVLEEPGGRRDVALEQGGTCVIVPKGTWHTVRTKGPCRLLFITAGEGTAHREVDASARGARA